MIETLRANIKSLRESRGLTQETLSKRCNYDKTYVGKIERGDTNPSFEALLRIADVLEIPSIKLFQADVSENPEQFHESLETPTDQLGRLFMDIFENNPSISFLTNSSGDILEINKAAKKFLKANANAVVGESLSELSFWSQSGVNPEVIEELLELASTGRKATRRVQIRYKGRELDLQIQVSHARDGEAQESFVIFQMVSLEDTIDRTLIGDHFDLMK